MKPSDDGQGRDGPRAVPERPAQVPEASPDGEPQPIHPQRLLRIASVAHEVLEEVRRMRPEPGAVTHLRRLHARILDELRQALPADLYDELHELTPAIEEGSLEELAIAHAEILGWLEGLFQGTQLAFQLEVAGAFRDKLRAELTPPVAEKEEPEPAESPYL